MRNLASVAVWLMLMILTASQWSFLRGGEKASILLAGLPTSTDGGWVIPYEVRSGDYADEFTVAYFPVSKFPRANLPLYIYYDYTYKDYTSWTPYHAIVTGLYHDLTYQANVRGLNGSVSLVNLQQLKDLLKSSKEGVLIIVTVAYEVNLLPPPIGSAEILQWITDGGVVVWLGPPPEEFRGQVAYVKTSTAVPGWDDIGNWSAHDIPPTRPSEVSVRVNGASDGHRWITITQSDLSHIDRGFYGMFTPPHRRGLFPPTALLSFDVKITSMENLSLFYVELKDDHGNFRHYYVPFSSLSEGNWRTVQLGVASPNRTSITQLDLNDSRVLFTGQVYPKENRPGAFAEIQIRNIKVVEQEPLIPTQMALTRAQKDSEASRALGLSYAYVNNGALVSALNRVGGYALGKIQIAQEDVRTAIALLPFGRGKILIFGFGIYPPYFQDLVAKDVMQLIESGVLHVTGPVRYRVHKLPRRSRIADRLTLEAGTFTKLRVFFFSSDEATAYGRKTLDLRF